LLSFCAGPEKLGGGSGPLEGRGGREGSRCREVGARRLAVVRGCGSCGRGQGCGQAVVVVGRFVQAAVGCLRVWDRRGGRGGKRGLGLLVFVDGGKFACARALIVSHSVTSRNVGRMRWWSSSAFQHHASGLQVVGYCAHWLCFLHTHPGIRGRGRLVEGNALGRALDGLDGLGGACIGRWSRSAAGKDPILVLVVAAVGLV